MNKNPRLPLISLARPLRLLACFGTLTALSSASADIELQWGSDGQGGSGIWDINSANWWNGSAATTWQSGGYATFAGPGGTIIVDGPEVSDIRFAAGEYRLTEGNLIATFSRLNVRTQPKPGSTM